MIVENGRIQVLEKSETTVYDENGFPSESEAVWGAEFPCQFKAAWYSNKAKSENSGTYVSASFEILIELPEEVFDYEQLRLYDNFGKIVGEYSVTSATPLAVVGLLRIIV